MPLSSSKIGFKIKKIGFGQFDLQNVWGGAIVLLCSASSSRILLDWRLAAWWWW